MRRRSGSSGTPIDALITDASNRPGLVALRELGRGGVVTCAVDASPGAPAFVSRWCAVSAVVPDFILNQDAYIDALLDLCAEHQPRALIPSHDGSIDALRARRADVERAVGLALAPEEALSVAVDKPRTFAVAEKLGLRLPRGAVVRRLDEAEAALDEVGLPAVTKPAQSWVQNDAPQRLVPLVATDRAKALEAIHSMLDQGVEVVVQEWLPGDREALSFFFAEGRFWARFAQRADRTLPPLGGNSVFRESIPMPPDITPAAERLVQEMELEGYSEVEFRRDAAGGAALMEINPRLSASVEIAVRAGVSFPRLLYDWASGEPLQEVGDYRTGLRMRWLGGDLSWLRDVLTNPKRPDVPSRRAALGLFLSDFFQRSGYDYMARDDIRPALKAAGGATIRARRRLRKGVRGADNSFGAADTDVAVVGAGPYGLSVSAHLTGQGTRHEIFGERLDTWRNHMPEGMYLKSEGYATSLSDPSAEYTLERFCTESDLEYAPVGVPVSIGTFIGYGCWFQERVVPRLDPRRVETVRSTEHGFELTLDGGDALRACRVVEATGVQSYPYVPPELAQLPPDRVVHTYHHVNPADVPEGGVAVIGAGQSALEGATLIHEHGGDVRVIARTPMLQWGSKPGALDRPLREKLKYPESGLGQGRAQRFYANHPLIVHAGPEGWRLDKAFSILGPGGAWWLRPRFEGKVETSLQRRIVEAHAEDGGVRLRLDGIGGNEEFVVGQVVAGTGYSPDISRVSLLDPSIIERIATVGGAPVLDRSFQSSVPGLYFVGYAAAPSFGPLMRFVFGADFAARRVARRLLS